MWDSGLRDAGGTTGFSAPSPVWVSGAVILLLRLQAELPMLRICFLPTLVEMFSREDKGVRIRSSDRSSESTRLLAVKSSEFIGS
jgi:hypothetical protein